MPWLNGQTVRVAVVAAALLSVAAFAAQDDLLDFDEPVVPPGQEELLSAMLGRGATLPDDCKFAGGGADGPVIQTTYTCPSGKVVFDLVHPDNADDEATQTERFAMTLQSGSPPEALEDALVWLIRSREADFEWVWLTEEDDGDEDEAHLAPDDL